MSDRELRYTGDNPPLEILERLPNWEYALDEEDVDGQDETTLRPAAEQGYLASRVVFSAGVVTLASGEQFPAFLEIANGRIEGVTAYAQGTWAWTLRLVGSPARWQPLDFEWRPESERPPAVSLSDPAVFPMVIESSVPVLLGGPFARVAVGK